MTHALHWFRSDLRIHDNKALSAAIDHADNVTTVFIMSPGTWKTHHCSPHKLQFMLESLQVLSTNLAKLGIPLIIEEQNTFNDCINTLSYLCDKHNIDTLYFNKQYELDEAHRDDDIIEVMRNLDIPCHAFDDQTIAPPGKILNLSGEPYKVFTPFKKRWLKEVAENIENYLPIKIPNKSFNSKIKSSKIPNAITGFKTTSLHKAFLPGEDQALNQLKNFCKTPIATYHLQRDIPSLNGTSQLSPALTAGTLSVRQCLNQIIKLTQGDILNDKKYPGELTWLSELIWRDFYKDMLFHNPHLCKHKPFKPATDRIPWNNDQKLLLTWQQGKTGFPIVDAAMRQLNQTGWMHNRLRMVTAMFLSKTLFLDWRLGEKYFMENLIDGDLAANNGGWQWSASTGADAVPYFRIFNPTTQSERFDKEGTFIRKYCPELASLSNKEIHDPFNRGIKASTINYPKPIVDYKAMRAFVIAQFKEHSQGETQ